MHKAKSTKESDEKGKRCECFSPKDQFGYLVLNN